VQLKKSFADSSEKDNDSLYHLQFLGGTYGLTCQLSLEYDIYCFFKQLYYYTTKKQICQVDLRKKSYQQKNKADTFVSALWCE